MLNLGTGIARSVWSLPSKQEDLSSDSLLKTRRSCTPLLVRVEWGEVGDGPILGGSVTAILAKVVSSGYQ